MLNDLTVDGTTIDSFNPAITSYTVELPYGTVNVPEVNGEPANENAQVQVTPAPSVPGTTTVLVTAQDGKTKNTYSVNFTVAQPVVSTYKFTYDLTGKTFIAGDAAGTQVPVTLTADMVNDIGYSNVRVNVSVAGPGTAQLIAEDAQGNAFDVAQIGYWGPETGFPIAKDYNITTNFTSMFGTAGQYTATLTLFDVAANQAITSVDVTVIVNQNLYK
jgi:hypothetical protein